MSMCETTLRCASSSVLKYSVCNSSGNSCISSCENTASAISCLASCSGHPLSSVRNLLSPPGPCTLFVRQYDFEVGVLVAFLAERPKDDAPLALGEEVLMVELVAAEVFKGPSMGR
jgi:hypothetical protein